jgi:hypothetical protein
MGSQSLGSKSSADQLAKSAGETRKRQILPSSPPEATRESSKGDQQVLWLKGDKGKKKEEENG